MSTKKFKPFERWAVVDTSGRIIVVFERAKTTKAWAQWVADGKRGRRVARVRVTEITEPKS